MSDRVLGVVLAGGRSRRYGASKGMAEVGGRPIAARVADALRGALPEVVVITHEPDRFAALGLPSRPDRLPGGGPLAGVHAALGWAAERGEAGALCVACDMPFVTECLVRTILRRADGTGIVAPAGPGGEPEPLCAFYPVGLLPEVEARLARGERAMRRLLRAVRTEIAPLAEVERCGSASVLFMNVNTPADREAAEALARRGEEPNGGR